MAKETGGFWKYLPREKVGLATRVRRFVSEYRGEILVISLGGAVGVAVWWFS